MRGVSRLACEVEMLELQRVSDQVVGNPGVSGRGIYTKGLIRLSHRYGGRLALLCPVEDGAGQTRGGGCDRGATLLGRPRPGRLRGRWAVTSPWS